MFSTFPPPLPGAGRAHGRGWGMKADFFRRPPPPSGWGPGGGWFKAGGRTPRLIQRRGVCPWLLTFAFHMDRRFHSRPFGAGRWRRSRHRGRGRGKGGGGPRAGQSPRPPLRGRRCRAGRGEGGRFQPGGAGERRLAGRFLACKAGRRAGVRVTATKHGNFAAGKTPPRAMPWNGLPRKNRISPTGPTTRRAANGTQRGAALGNVGPRSRAPRL